VGVDETCDTGSLVIEDSTAAQRRRAVCTVATHARNAADLAELLDMLGLSATDGRAAGPAPEEPPGPPPGLLAELAALREWLADR
jgi:hypothetical protein